ncbi:PKD domain-containing protein [Croceitalea rosinachiae]|uniref:PKD domain-containing protein n=1 Tax=Croceitalea rosinachiae TaxID=3075596 RepID=A0ABU3AD63_9FLAO|nr:PKD domain-containing protein [Croceitalea sp. F388]MDT0608121.1 PKD domain-containing protein [Croceitalea sp. F388]
MKNLFKKARILSMVILVLAFLGCEDDDEGTTLPSVTAGFTFDLIPNTGSVSFINVSENADTFEWDFGNEATSTEIDPTVTFASGTYTVTLTANNVAGASDTFEDEITISIPEPPGPLALPIDFDGTNVDYDTIVGDNIGFSVATNPETGNGNTTNVGQMVAGGGQFQNVQFPLGTAVDFSSENKTIQLELFSSTEIAVLVKFEDGDGARDVEVGTTHTGSGWETLNFDFATDGVASFIDGDPQNGQALVPDGQYGGMILFIGFNTDPGVQGTFLVDNIVQTTAGGGGNINSGCSDTPVAAASLPLDFEACDTFASEFNFGSGITSELAANPAKGGINDSDFVLKVDKPAGSDFFAGIQNTFASNFDLTTTDAFKLKVYSSKANTVFRFELALNPQTDPVTGNPAPVFVTVPNANEWAEVEVVFTGLPGGPMAYNQLVIKPDNTPTDDPITDGGTYYFDDLRLEAAGSGGGFDSGLLTNGDFENGGDSWIGNALNVQTEGGNSFNFADVQMAGDPFSVNLSQVVEITQGTNYTLTFDASSDQARTMLAGIGLNEAPFTNTAPEVNLTTETQTFTLQLAANDFGGANSRILFDMGAAVGTVVIDNVSLVEGGDGSDTNGGGTGGTFDDGLLTNGDFENGGDSWIGNALNVQTEGGNSFNFADVQMAGDPFSVNLSQVVEITQGTNYTLTFDASSDQARTMLAGIGLNEAPFTNTAPEVNLTTETQTFTLQLAANDFGGANSRILFDMGAAVGTVVIDNVSLVEGGDGSDTNGGGTGGGCTGSEVSATTLPLDFEGCESFISAFSSIGDGGVVPSLDANPSASGINTSDNVLKVVRASGINRWGGVQNSFPAGTIDITTQVFKVKVYSSVPDVTYRFELALDPQTDPVTGNPAPVFRQVSGGANTWTEIEFTFINLPATPTTYNQLVIKPDNPDGSDGEVTTEERTFYFDDLRLE